MKEMAILALYAITLVVILIEFSSQWGLAIVMMLILVITLLVKMTSEERINDVKKDRELYINVISERLNAFSNRVEDLKSNINKNAFNIQNRIYEVEHSAQIEMESNYRDLAKKIFDLENRLGDVKKTLGAAYGSLDERLQRFEKEEEWSG